MIRRVAPLTVILAGLAAGARADTYIWAGNTGDFTNPASWIGAAPAVSGSPTQQLLFPLLNFNPYDPPQSPYTATVDLPWTLNSITFTSTGTSAIAAAPGAGLFFGGPNPTMTRIGNTNGNAAIFDTPVTTTSDLTFSGGMTYILNNTVASTSNGSLNVTGGGTLIYQSDTAPAGFAQTLLDGSSGGSTLGLNIAAPDSNPVNLSFGAGPIISTSGTLAINLMASPQVTDVAASFSNPLVVYDSLRLIVTATKPVPTDLYVPGQVVGPGGYLEAANSLPPIYTASFDFTGPISLGGELLLAPNSYWGPLPSTAAQSTSFKFSGTITLDQSSTKELRISFNDISDPQHAVISGNIVDDPNPAHTARNPLRLNSYFGYPYTNSFIISGTHNTYSTGTIVEGGAFTIAPGSSLGTGPITVQFGTLNLTSPTNLNPGQKVLLQYEQGGTLAINFDTLPYAFLDPASKGTLAINTTFSTPLDMSQVGNGSMTLSSNTNGIYAANSLRPDSDHIYRLAGNLTLTHSVLADYDGFSSTVLLDGANLAAPNYYSGGTTVSGWATASAPGALGSGNIIVGIYPGYPGIGILYLAAPNTYLPTTKVDVFGSLSAIGPDGSIPLSNSAPIFHTGSALILGDGISNNSNRYPDSMPINLDGTNLVVKGFGITNEVVGPITVSNVATIVLWNPATGSHTTTLTAPYLTRVSRGVLLIVPFQSDAVIYGPGVLPFTPSGENNANFQITSAPAVTNGIVAPWIQSRETFFDNVISDAPPSFLTYGSVGFASAVYVTMPQGAGTATEVVDAVGPNGNLLITGDKFIYALRTSANILANDPKMPTVHISSGGLIAVAGVSHPFSPIIIQSNVDFENAEALVNVQGAGVVYDTASLDIKGVVTASQGLTKFGTGTLRLSNPANQINGPITILEGNLDLAFVPDPTSVDPIEVSDRATLNFLTPTVLTRPLTIKATGDLNPFFGGYITTTSGNSFTIAAPINANTHVTIISGASLKIAAPITVSHGLSLYASQVDLQANISAGSVNFATGRQGKITGNAVLSSPSGMIFDMGAISPGTNPGDLATLTFDMPGLDIYDGASFFFDLDSAGHSDHIFITGSFSVVDASVYPGEPINISLNFLAPPTGDIYTLVSASQINGTFDTVTGLPAGYGVEYTPTSILLVPASASANISAPEPASAGVLVFGGMLLLRRGRRRNEMPRGVSPMEAVA